MNPFVQNPSNSQNYNRFSYCLNNPLKYVDPSGYIALNPWFEYTDKFRNRFFKEFPEMFEDFYDSNGKHWKLREDMNFSDENGNVYLRKIDEGLYVELKNYQENQEKLQEFNSLVGNAEVGFVAGAGTFRVEGERYYNIHLRYEIIPSTTSEFDGFGGKLKYFFNGGNVDGWKYDINGKYVGAAPIGGTAPVPSFRGFKIIQLGGHILSKSTLNALQITKEEGKIAIEAMKKANQLPPDFHGNIGMDGSFWSKTGENIDNILEYIK